ncbi:MAG: thioredoxin family protein [Candidatus Thalassarchaeum sp.]|nr:thioredoxin family protein [Candidatus Thalassarchaeum sp.]
MSRGLEPGDAAPPFELPNANSDGPDQCSLSNIITDIGCVIVFTCNHCPYVIGNESRIECIASRAREEGMGFAGINSNDPDNYPTDNWEHMLKRGETMSYAYLHDATQEVAHAWGAERTPEFYLLDSNGIITYRGRLDDSPRDPSLATTSELSDAIDALLADESPDIARTDSIGCSVKWKV